MQHEKLRGRPKLQHMWLSNGTPHSPPRADAAKRKQQPRGRADTQVITHHISLSLASFYWFPAAPS